jgi:non-canonical purine NTP pyrophosphatase (RdgB/HAM1 family)
MELVLATRNAHKTREFRELLGNEFEIIDLGSLPALALPEETGRTFEENAILKAVTVSKTVNKLVIADDSGLEVDALDGAPGIYSARYAGENAGDAANVDKLLRELSSVRQRSARFRCVIALVRAREVLGIVQGLVEGTITDQPRGNNGFGYDPVFQPVGFAETFAELRRQSKNEVSHRSRAAAALREKLREIAD